MTTQAQEPQMDQHKAEAFAGQVLGMMNGAAMTLLISVGHRTGLFDTMAMLPPSNSDQIANAAKLNERYVREWLNGLVVGKIVEYDPTMKTYSLPPEHAGFLTRAAGANNFALYAQMFPQFGTIEDKVVESFRNGSGVPYSALPSVWTLQREMTVPLHDAVLIDVVLPMAQGVKEKLQKGIAVADLGCGAGHSTNLMARSFPSSRFVGMDFSDEAIVMARKEAAEWGLTNVRFEVEDIAEWNPRGTYDLITVLDAVHDQAHPRTVLKNIFNALKPGGVFLMGDENGSSNVEDNLEFPMAPILYTCSVFHCMTVSLAQGGEGLGTMWGEQQARELLAEAGFKTVDVKHIEGDLEHAYFITNKG